jgi:hypothetical protein
MANLIPISQQQATQPFIRQNTTVVASIKNGSGLT